MLGKGEATRGVAIETIKVPLISLEKNSEKGSKGVRAGGVLHVCL